jgi:hypothetical protein
MPVPRRVSAGVNSPFYNRFQSSLGGRFMTGLSNHNKVFETLFTPVFNRIKKVTSANSPLAGALTRLGSR